MTGRRILIRLLFALRQAITVRIGSFLLDRRVVVREFVLHMSLLFIILGIFFVRTDLLFGLRNTNALRSTDAVKVIIGVVIGNAAACNTFLARDGLGRLLFS